MEGECTYEYKKNVSQFQETMKTAKLVKNNQVVS